MKIISHTPVPGLALVVSSVGAANAALNHYKTLTLLEGDRVLSPTDQQEGGATKKGPAVKYEHLAMQFCRMSCAHDQA